MIDASEDLNKLVHDCKNITNEFILPKFKQAYSYEKCILFEDDLLFHFPFINTLGGLLTSVLLLRDKGLFFLLRV